MNHVMIDLETLGVTPGSVILSIGAVTFSVNDPPGIQLALEIDAADAQRAGLTIDAATVAWWLGQGEAARLAVTRGDRLPLSDALRTLEAWLGARRIGDGSLRVWAHGPSFDLAILAAAYRIVGLPTPWRYQEERDTRTLYELAGVNPADYRSGTAHRAIDDAICQAYAVHAGLRRLEAPAAVPLPAGPSESP